MIRVAFALLVSLRLIPTVAAERAELLIADFESDGYGGWKVEGTAFGDGPAAGTLPGQMEVTGFEGKRLVNSFVGGDDATGVLMSPPFSIERKYVNFLVGGGAYANETCVDLLVDGNVVRSATGPNDRPGGSERLEWRTWDVSDLAGRDAVIRVVDRRKGGWGHVSVDQIVQSDARRQAEPVGREVAVRTRYLHLPVKTGAAKRRMKYVVDGATVREFEIELADGEPDLYVFSDVSPFAGKTLRIEVDGVDGGPKALERIVASDELPDAGALYDEPLRPQFHFTSRRGWLNDPNGLVFHDGEWHLFYQHNPYGVQWGNMHWGHAVSPDLVRWKELPIGLYPKEFGDWAFSGSAVVDHGNTSGFGEGGKPPLVLAYTSTGRGECVAYSNDAGRTWTEHDGNPAVRHQGRDPKLVWHEPTSRWVMAVYQEKKEGDADEGRFIAFYSSPDLEDWAYESRIEGFFECPDLFELPVGDSESESKWVLYAADGEYMLGDFDGKAFNPASGKHKLWHGNFYAAQSYDNAPDGRRVQIGWGRGIELPGMPFNQQMVVPVELTLRSTGDGVRMFAEPVKEVASLRGKRHAWSDVSVSGTRPLDGPEGDLFDIEATIETGDAESAGFSIRGVPVKYDAAKGELTCHTTTMPVALEDGAIRLRLLVDRGSIEVFTGGGATAMSVGVIPPAGDRSIKLTAEGGTARFRSLVVHEMKSAWD